MDKNDIINYVMHTPHNTNKAVLSDMLNQLTEGGGAEPLIIHGTAVETEEGVVWQLDKTPAEIENSYKMGGPAVFKLDNVDEYICPQEITFDYDESSTANGFFFRSSVGAYGDTQTNQFAISFTEYALENNGELTYQYTSYNLTDLTVSNG